MRNRGPLLAGKAAMFHVRSIAALCALLVTVSSAAISFAQTPWTATGGFLTPLSAGNNGALVASPNGDLYIAGMAGLNQPTGKFGDLSQGWTWISRVSAAGMPVFADWIGGARMTQAELGS